ncbi:MAG: WD40/YVTN/BNR-like repeat-containing protein, partial [Candidatus Acidiferrales bacterium]
MLKFDKFLRLLFVSSILVFALVPTFAQEVSPSLYSGLKWRLIGPHRGGRVLAVSGIAGQPYIYYFGGVGGGAWKTINDGEVWTPVFDHQSIASIGAIAISPSDANVIYVGTGEADMRSDISFGDGVYKSTDAGRTWSNIGLRDSMQIGRILVDPRDPEIVLVAALGHAYGPNTERGVFRSTDGGATWQKVLYKDEDTGAIDLAFDPNNSRIVYASLWQARSTAWSAYPPVSGPGSGLYKSTDSGITWQQITGRGFPSEGLGHVGIAVARGENGNRVYAIVDAKEGGLYRSDDAGQNWARTSSDPRIWGRGWYFGGITIDPNSPDTVYLPNVALYRSTDGGKNFTAIKGAPGGDDYHSLWIAPENSRRMILGCDQGAIISVDGGETWSSWFNQPTAQFYHVATDNQFPYRVYGAQQDSGTSSITSRGDFGEITFRDWFSAGAGEAGYILPDPIDPKIIYGGDTYGSLFRLDLRTGQSQNISPSPVSAFGTEISQRKYRFTWTSPLAFSPQDPHTLYMGAQYILKSSDEGKSWQEISPDLTGADTSNQAARNGPPSLENSKARGYGVVYTIAPSPISEGLIWAGTDTGLIQLTRDGGKSWTRVTPSGLSDWSKISMIDASLQDAGTAYAAVDRHRLNDYAPYIFGTHDFGKTWTKITAGIPTLAYVHAVREDPERKGLLFAGTELGVYFSFDDGAHWQ